MAMFKKKPSSN